MPNGYGTMTYRGKTRYAHRLAYGLTSGPIPEGMEVEHRCRNRSCANPRHLRLATHKQNQENRDANKGSASGFRGVYLHKPSGLWCARASHHGKVHYAGYFKDVEEAGRAARDLRNELFTYNELDKVTA